MSKLIRASGVVPVSNWLTLVASVARKLPTAVTSILVTRLTPQLRLASRPVIQPLIIKVGTRVLVIGILRVRGVNEAVMSKLQMKSNVPQSKPTRKVMNSRTARPKIRLVARPVSRINCGVKVGKMAPPKS